MKTLRLPTATEAVVGLVTLASTGASAISPFPDGFGPRKEINCFVNGTDTCDTNVGELLGAVFGFFAGLGLTAATLYCCLNKCGVFKSAENNDGNTVIAPLVTTEGTNYNSGGETVTLNSAN